VHAAGHWSSAVDFSENIVMFLADDNACKIKLIENYVSFLPLLFLSSLSSHVS
jgi:hypothetical protein